VANLDTVTTIPKRCLTACVATLPPAKVADVDRALRFALGLT
jgi:mRNA-degrading endonuclease toxin of MazEF toxin-antitoxin module